MVNLANLMLALVLILIILKKKHILTNFLDAPMNSSTVCADKLPATQDQRLLRDSHSPNPTLAAFELGKSGEPDIKFFTRKYYFDRMVGIGLLVFTAPVTIVLCCLIKLSSRGPGFYRQTRVGLDGKEFDIVKLRTMIVDSEPGGQAVWCVQRDPRITRFGRILRKTHLDELPQLWNVAKGEMSLVGPRPERPEICEELAGKIAHYYDRNAVKPGVTGLAQINLPPDESFADVERKQILDLRYIDEAGLWLEVRILAATGLRMIGVRGKTVMKVMRLCRSHLLPPRSDGRRTCEGEPSFAYSGPVKPR
ncbi:MAG: sugar transferase [Rubripirellula sp.]